MSVGALVIKTSGFDASVGGGGGGAPASKRNLENAKTILFDAVNQRKCIVSAWC